MSKPRRKPVEIPDDVPLDQTVGELNFDGGRYPPKFLRADLGYPEVLPLRLRILEFFGLDRIP